MTEHAGPRLEGTIAVAPGRRLGFAEFGPPRGRAVIWLHGTPGARRQIPHEARILADELGVRIVGIDRPGIGSSTPHVYGSVLDFVADLETVADRIGLEEFAVIGLSGGGPYALAAGHALPHRVPVVVVLGGVPPTVGPDRVPGGILGLGTRFAPLIERARVPTGLALTGLVRLARPAASPILGAYARVSPEGDRRLLNRPEFRAMFLDDLLNGSRKQLTAPLADILLFSRDWGFRLADVGVPVRWWHGDGDHIIPFDHGRRVVARLPDAVLHTMAGESHLGGLAMAAEVLRTILDLWDDR